MAGTGKKRFKRGSFDLSYGILFLAAFIALILLGPLRETPAGLPPLLLAATLVLFMLPGTVLASLLDDEGYGGLARVPFAFVFSTGVFGLLALPPLVLKWSLVIYLLACGAMVALSLVGVVFLAIQPARRTEPPEQRRGGRWLWIPLGAMTAVLAHLSLRVFYVPYSDTWAYLMYVQNFLGLGKVNAFIPGFGRSTLSGWLLEQAALSRVSGVGPVDLALGYLAPVLVVVGILAFYSLVRILFETRTAALLATSLAILFYLTHLDASNRSPGSELIGRVVEDKFVVRFVFLPVALGLVVLFLRRRKLRYLGLFAFVCISVVPVHPLGLVLIGMSVTGFGLVHLVANRRNLDSWKSFGAVGGVMLGIVLLPLAYLVATGSSLLSRLDSRNPTLANESLTFFQDNELLLALGEGSYIMHPALLLTPVVLAAYVLGVPFLIWRVKGDLAAQLLLGMLLFTAALVYIPPVATFVSGIIGPWTLWRVAWPISLAALVTLGWMVWELLRYATTYLSRWHAGRKVAPFLPLALVCILIAAFVPVISAGSRSAAARGETPQDAATCFDPTFPWMQGALETPATVLAPDEENSCFPPYVAARYVAYRGAMFLDGSSDSGPDSSVPGNVADVQKFFDAPTVDGNMVATLQRYSVDYVLLPADSPLNAQLKHLPGFSAMDNPGNRYRMYSADPAGLAVTQLQGANGFLNRGEWEAALTAYDVTLQGDEDEQFLAHLGSGLAYMGLNLPEQAVGSYEQALMLFPDSTEAYALMADAYRAMGDPSSARAVLEEAVSTTPRNVDLRLELGDLMLENQDEQEAVKQFQEVVELFPDVPEYHVRLGGALAQAGRTRDAEEEFGRAVSLHPLSVDVLLGVGLANVRAGRLERAVDYYERASRLEPDDLAIELRLGRAYTMLSINEDQNKKYAGLAEEHFENVTRKESDVRDEAYVGLGALYESQDQTEKATTAYEKALDVNPDSASARKRLEGLRGRR